MCGHQSSDHGLRNNGRNFCKHPIWGCLRPFWDKIWPKYKISGTILNDPVKHPRWLNLLKNAQKGLGGSICTLQAHSETSSQNPKFDNFHHWTCKAKLWVCHMGAYTHPKPFFWKFLGFLKKIKHFSYLDRLRTRKTRWFMLGQS